MKASITKLILAVLTIVSGIVYTSISKACECIVSGETKSATIEFAGETHCYTFWGEARQGIVIQMADDDVTWPPRLQLYDPNGVLVAEAVDSSYPYTCATIENYQLEMRGIYTIVASYGGGVSEYGLSLVLTGGTMTSPDDKDGGDVTPYSTRIGNITPNADTDIYVYYGHAGQGVNIEVADTEDAWSPRIQVYDPDGVLVIEAVDGVYPYTYTAIENYQLENTGIYTIVVSYSGGTSEYGMSVSVIPPNDPNSIYPYDAAPADGNSIDLCDWDTLSWWPVDGATGYDVYFSGSPCMPLEMIAEDITNPYLPMPEVEDGQFCSWRVVAHTPNGDIQGPTWWFSAEPCVSCGLNISSIGQGSIVEPNTGLNSYSCGEVVSVTAMADINYEFIRWEGSAVDADKINVEYQDNMGSRIWVSVDGIYTLRAVFEEIVYDFTLDSDPGWIMEGQWEFGIPAGQGGEEYGYPDPVSGHTGQNVFGVNLNGNYNLEIGGPYSLVTDPFDLTAFSDVHLRFWQWLNTDAGEYVKNSLEMSLDGATWLLVLQNPEREDTVNNEWNRVECDVSNWADGQPVIYLRWNYQVLRERAYPYSGWNLDDIQLIGHK